MKLEKFHQLTIGEKVRIETCDGDMTGIITNIKTNEIEVSTKEGYFYSTPRQVLSKIVKRKKPKLVKIGYAIYSKEMTVKEYAYRSMEIATLGDVSPQRESEDTHEVWVRQIVRKK